MRMKKIVLFACLIFSLVFTVTAQKVEVNSKGFFINRHKITRETTMAVIDSLIGKPDRIFLLANTIWTYDSLGLFVYFAPQDSSLKQVSFDLVKRALKFSPATPFAGRFVIHDNLITSAWSLARLKRIKSLKFEENVVYLSPAYTSYVKMYFEFDETKKVLRYAGVALEFKKND
jgi:hypothetical protein